MPRPIMTPAPTPPPVRMDITYIDLCACGCWYSMRRKADPVIYAAWQKAHAGCTAKDEG